MPPTGMTLVAIAIAYLIGAIPVGVVVCRPFGVDPRRFGSGRTGGTNVYRAAGARAAVLTVLGDVLKGTTAVLLADRLVPGDANAVATALAALAAILGHNHSIFIRFAGGAGSTPNIGAFLALAPGPQWFAAAGLAACAVWYFGRIASVASLTLAACLALACAWFATTGARSPAILIYGLGQLALVAWALRPNIARLRQGTELRVDRPAGSESPPVTPSPSP